MTGKIKDIIIKHFLRAGHNDKALQRMKFWKDDASITVRTVADRYN